MSTKLGTLTLDLVTRTAGFTAPIKTAEKQTVTSFDAMKKSVLTYGAIAVSGAAAVGAGVLAMANEYANAARELQTFASISNTTTQEFQKMAVGAETMGISSEKLADQLKDFNEKLGEFITIGSGGAVDFFEQIAIKTEGSAEAARKLALEMQNLSGPKALQLYVDKLEEAGVTQQQMSFYLESMASDTTNLIPLLRDGGKGFEYWADAAERAGVIMDEHAIEKANELRVQMDLLNLQVQGVKNQFIQGLMPALVSVGDGLSDATLQTNLMSDAGETLGEVFKGVAATGMGVYAVVKMLTNSIAGLAAQAAQSKQMVDKAAEGGSFFDKLPGVKITKAFILGATNAQVNKNSPVQMAAQDNAQVADDVASSINRIYNDAANQSVSAMAKIQNSQAGVTKGSDEWIKKQNEVAKATKENTKAQNELNKAIELGNRLIYDFGDEQLRISEDLKKDLADIQSAALKPDAKARYATLAQMQADARKKLYIAELDFELNEHNSTEERKLTDELRINKLRLDAQRGLNKNEIELRKQALDKVYSQNLTMLRISQQKELLQTKQLWLSASEYAEQYYALVREEILNTASYSPETKDAMIKQANMQQGMEQNAERENVWEDYQYRFEPESQYQRDIDLLKEARDQMLITEEEYQRDRIALQAGYGGEYLNSLSGFFGSMLGKSSSAYQALFFAQKSFYLAQAGMNVWKSASDAYANEPGTVWQKMGAAALATLESGSFLSLIEAATPMGMAHDGIDNIPKEGTWLLDKGERVVDSRTNADLKDYLAKGGGSGGDVYYTQTIHIASDGSATSESDAKQLGKMMENMTLAVIRREQRQGGLLSK
ncbi:phage tail tape measure protein [Acinetobacter variabilis]|uniref:hypothetical protein n=2 Tax=Gammaproteobacteria TaxID=1236 RepID=UPI00376FF768